MKTVLCHGVFDILHAGHLAYFKAARKYGDTLIVSITTDRFVNKGPGRPYFTTEQRANMLRSLRLIDEVVVSDEPTALGVIHKLKPNFYCKGPDYRDFSKDVTGEILNEKAAVEKHGGQLVFTAEPTYSSGTLINRFLAEWTDEQRTQIEKINELGGIKAIKQAIDEIAKLKVLVVGEPILDVYRFVTPEGISSKSPSISARFINEETYMGGSLAIRSHLMGFAEQVTLQSWNNTPAKKVRYISGNQRIFEVTDIQDQYWDNVDPTFFCDKVLEVAEKSDLVIACDFGHGMFEREVLSMMEEIKGFLALNVQSNSSNFGFNVFTKHKRFDYLCIDTREARLALHNRWALPQELFGTIVGQCHPRWVAMTEGANGASMARLSKGVEIHRSPAFSSNMLDPIGCGDAYFCLTSALLKTGCEPDLIPFIGCVFAGIKGTILGNKSSVSKAALLKAASGILK